MTGDTPMMVIVAMAALALVSWLLWMQFGALGVPRYRVRRLLIELWVSFALIFGFFALAGWIIGYVPRRANPAEEFQAWWTRLQALPLWAQVVLVLALVLALAILGRFFWSLSTLRRAYEAPDDGTMEDT